MRTNTVLTLCGSKVRYISHLSLTPKFDEPHALKQRAVYYVYNENEHKTHALFLVSSSEFVSDPRPRVTRPAPAGHATCARGSLTLCRSGTGNGPARLGTSSAKRKSGSAERELGLAERHSRSEKPCAASSVALVQRSIVLPLAILKYS